MTFYQPPTVPPTDDDNSDFGNEPKRVIIATMGQIPDLLRHDPGEPERRRIRNAQNTARFLEFKPECLGRPPSLKAIEPALRAFIAEAVRHGITQHRAESIASSVRSVIRWTRRVNRSVRARSDMHPAWAALVLSVLKLSDRIAIGSFAVWMSSKGLLPEETSDFTVEQYRQHREEEGKRLPNATIRALIRAWNRARQDSTIWPAIALTMPLSQKIGTRLEEFSPEFQADLARYIATSVNPTAPVADATGKVRRYNTQATTGRRKAPKRPETARGYAACLRRGAGMLARHRGQPLTVIKSLRELVQPGVPEILMEEIADQRGECPAQRLMLQALKDVAVNHVTTDTAVLHEIAVLLKLIPAVKMEMSERNRALLHSLEVEDLTRLFAAPQAIRNSVEKRLAKKEGKPNRTDVAEARVAVCLVFLLYTPPRILNLTNMRFVTNLHIPQKVGRLGRLSYVGTETKSKRPFAVPIKTRALEMVRWYRKVILDKIAPGTDLLFPSDTIPGVPIETQTLRSCLVNVVQRYTGLRIHPHFYRHLVAHLILVRHPDQIENVAKLLGHADARTTLAYYATDAAQAALLMLGRFLERTAEDLLGDEFDPSTWVLDAEDLGDDDAPSPRRRKPKPKPKPRDKDIPPKA